MAQVLKLYWSNSKPNFGDWLSPAICAAVCHREVRYASIKRCDLVALGSLFERLPTGWLSRSLHVWGTGSIQQQTPQRFKHTLHAVRGPRTASLGIVAGRASTQEPVFGDPGLLAEMLLPTGHQRNASITLGIIPHYKDADLPGIAAMLAHFPQAKIIDVFDSPQRVVERIARCHHVVSSSLHGLIVADALGVPARWLQLSDAVRGGGWKFRDYFESFDEPMPTRITRPLRLADVLGDNVDGLFADWRPPHLDAQKERLVNAFPAL